jgi:tape measure domain-containing protein
MVELGTVGVARVKVRVDFRGLRTELSRAVKQTQTGLAGIRTSRLNNDLKTFGSTANNSFKQSTIGARGFSNALLDIRAILPTLTAGFAIKSFFEFGDAAIRLRNRVRLVTDTSEEFRMVQERLFQISQATRTELEANTKLYSRLRLFTDKATFSSNQLFNVTELIGKAFRVSGAQAREAAGATIQFTQGIGSNKLGGEELRSVLEQGQRVAQALADGLNETGVAFDALGRKATVGDLKTLNEKGLLTAVNVIGALLTQTSKVDEEFQEVEKSISDAFTLLRNQALKSIGLVDEQTNSTRALVDAIGGITEFLDSAAFEIIFTGLAEAIAFATRNAGKLLAVLGIIAAGRLAQGIANLVVNIVSKVAAFNAAKFAALDNARAEVQYAATVQASTAADLAAARAAQAKATGRVAVAAASRTAATAEAAHAASTATLVGAQGRLRNAGIAATRSMRLLRGAMSFLGGPVGIAVAGLTTAFTLLGSAMFNASRQATDLQSRIDKIVNTPKSQADIIKDTIEEQTEALKKLDKQLNEITGNARRTGEATKRAITDIGGFEGVEDESEVVGSIRVEQEQIEELIEKRNTAVSNLKRLNDKLKELQGLTSDPKLEPEGIGGADDEESAIDALIRKKEEELAITKVQGLELAKLRAQIALTAAERKDEADATEKQKAALFGLVEKIFDEEKAREALEEQQERNKKLREDLKGIEDEIKAMEELIAALKESEKEYKIVSKQQEILSRNQDIGAEAARSYAERMTELETEMDGLMDKSDDASSAFKELGATFQSALEDAVVEAKKLSEVLDALVQDLFRVAFRKLATEPIFGSLATELDKIGKEDSGGFDGSNFLDQITGGFLFGGKDKKSETRTPTDLSIEDDKRARTIESLDLLNTAGKEASTTITNMSGATEGAANVLTGSLAAGAVEAAVGEKAKMTALQGATSALIEFTTALKAATAAAGGGGGSSLGIGSSFGSIFGGFGGGPGTPSITNSFGTFTGLAGRADGGLVTGPGTGRSDSILSALSNGEFVVNAAATGGNLPALETLNSTGKLPAGDLVFNIDGSSDPESVASEVLNLIQNAGGLTPRQAARNGMRSTRRLSGDGF